MRAASLIVLLLLGGCASRSSAPPGTAPPLEAQSSVTVPVDPQHREPAAAEPRPPAVSDVSGYIISYSATSAETTLEVQEILARAASTYKRTGHVTVAFGGLANPAWPVGRKLLARRVERAVWDLERRHGVWARAVVPGPDGSWIPWSADGPQAFEATLLLGPQEDRAVPHALPATSSPVPTPRSLGSGNSGRPSPAAAVASEQLQPPSPSTLGQVREWLVGRTLTPSAYAALIAECMRLRGSFTLGCSDAAANGEGGFAVVPQLALREFQSLVRTCTGGQDCSRSVGIEWQYRSLPVGHLDPQPRRMMEDVPTLFTAFIRDLHAAAAEAQAAGIANQTAGSSGAGDSSGGSIPYADRMCFLLTARPGDFRIEAVPPTPAPSDFVVEPSGEMCMNVNAAGGADKYQPTWWVTPLRPGDQLYPGDEGRIGTLHLMLRTKVVINREAYPRNFVPYPMRISILRQPTIVEQANAFLSAATETVKNATALVKAVSTLIAVVAGWGIWKLFGRWKRRRASRRDAAAGRP